MSKRAQSIFPFFKILKATGVEFLRHLLCLLEELESI